MTLKETLRGAGLRAPLDPEWETLPVASLEYDSRRVGPNTLFFAFQGQKTDGRNYAREAMERGACAVVSELDRPAGFDGPWIVVEHGRRALALAARAFYGAPEDRLALTGVTGTNGKTTVAHVIDSILRAANLTTALIGTIQYAVAGSVLPAVNTTPESLDLYRIFEELKRAGGSHVTMEVSSHALALGRVFGLRFHSAVFTNLTRDHLDFHKTMEAYFDAKQMLFEGCGAAPPDYAIVNVDDEAGRRLRVAPQSRRLTYGLAPEADVRASDVSAAAGGLEFDLHAAGKKLRVRSPLAGRFNVHNILAACGAGLSLGIAVETIVEGVERCQPVRGRFERVDEGQPFTVIVDYAHTDDALRSLIRSARELSPRRVITVFGCGGDRDRNKRPLMGAAVAELSDLAVLTSDNPRSEDPIAIMNDAMVGLGRFDTPCIVEPDRERAIRRALTEAEEGDIVLIAGKGHETYQILKDRTIPFDDREVARGVLRSLGYGREET